MKYNSSEKINRTMSDRIICQMVKWSTAHLKVVGVKRNVLLCLQKIILSLNLFEKHFFVSPCVQETLFKNATAKEMSVFRQMAKNTNNSKYFT